LTNSLEKTLHRFLPHNLFFCFVYSSIPSQQKGQSDDQDTGIHHSILFRDQVMLNGKPYLRILSPLRRAERLHRCLLTEECKWLHEWNSSEPLSGAMQRGKSLPGIPSVTNPSFCPQSDSDCKRNM